MPRLYTFKITCSCNFSKTGLSFEIWATKADHWPFCVDRYGAIATVCIVHILKHADYWIASVTKTNLSFKFYQIRNILYNIGLNICIPLIKPFITLDSQYKISPWDELELIGNNLSPSSGWVVLRIPAPVPAHLVCFSVFVVPICFNVCLITTVSSEVICRI